MALACRIAAAAAAGPQEVLRGKSFDFSTHLSAAICEAESASRIQVTLPFSGRTICAGSAPGRLCTCHFHIDAAIVGICEEL